MKTLMWYTEGLNKYLSSKGFVHYHENEAVNFDFREGRAFFFDANEKTLGLVDMIPSDKIDEATDLTSKFRENKTVEAIEKQDKK
jgi:hypothetical protein